ncbi:YoaK family protein [Kitasatospora sp. NPDC059571]|uniref:YoaK family protein n=1 Tax=Kitasatospora sp. NPDC059571 TaxID=3346871 RepID=UPI0036982FE9
MPDPADGPPRPRGARRTALVAGLLTLAAGAVNAFGFLALGAVFTSVVTANSALLGLHLGDGSLGAARLVAVALLGYLGGAAVGSLVAAGRGRLPAAGIRGALTVEAVLLWLVAAGWLQWHHAPDQADQALLLFATALAMGCQNAGVLVASGSPGPTAYLTGLVTATVADAVTRGRLRGRNAGTVLLLVAGAAAAGAAMRWLRPAAPVVPALLVTAALAATAGPRAAGAEEEADQHS